MGQLYRSDEDDFSDESLPGGGLALDTCRTCGVPLVILGALPADGALCEACERSVGDEA